MVIINNGVLTMDIYDPFKEGDKVWCEAYGFGIVSPKCYPDSMTVIFPCERGIDHSEKIGGFSLEGKMRGYEHRPRTLFHAVRETDEEMREVANNKGHLRQSRWDFFVGDKVLYVDHKGSHVGKVAETKSERFRGFPICIKIGEHSLKYVNSIGQAHQGDKIPSAMRIETCECITPGDVRKNMMFLLNCMTNANWERLRELYEAS